MQMMIHMVHTYMGNLTWDDLEGEKRGEGLV